DPAWGVLDPGGQLRQFKGPPISDFSGDAQGLRVSESGSEVAFGTKRNRNVFARFSLTKRTLIPDPGPDPGLREPTTSGVPITDWDYWSSSPKLGGVPLKLKRNEASYSVAVLPGGAGFVLGTQWSIRGFDRAGADLWPPVSAPAPTWAVNVA